MQDRNNNRLSLTVIAAITGVILAAGGGVAWWTKSNLNKVDVVQPAPTPITGKEASPPIPEPITQEKVVQICWLNPMGDNIKLVSKTMTFQKSVESKQVLRTALETLLTGRPGSDTRYTTAIPEGTKLLGLSTDERGVHVNLSKEFISGGGSASMSSRLAQIIYTATSSGQSERVWISVEGEPLENLGEEGLIVSQPMTQKKFEDNFTL